jgi:hypothetical protein
MQFMQTNSFPVVATDIFPSCINTLHLSHTKNGLSANPPLKGGQAASVFVLVSVSVMVMFSVRSVAVRPAP